MVEKKSSQDFSNEQIKPIFDREVVETAETKIGINPEGGYVSSWKIKSPETNTFDDVLYQGKTQKRTGIPTLFPYYGDADGMRSHGFGRDSTWKLGKKEGSKITMTLSSADIDEDARKEYPHNFKAEMTIQAGDDGSFIYNLRVSNMGNEPMPISPGLHPYWAIPHEDKKNLNIEGIDGLDLSHVDWDSNPPDNVYKYTGKTTISTPQRTITIEDITENKAATRHMVIWSQTPEKDDSDFVCVEPITGIDNAIKENPDIVPPGKEWNMRLKFTAKSNN